jgi:hypothetical protein
MSPEQCVYSVLKYIRERAPKSHTNFRVREYGHGILVTFIGIDVSPHITLVPGDWDFCKALAEMWPKEWTEFENADWDAILRQKSSTGQHMPEYPFISNHFDVKYLEDEKRYTVDIFNRTLNLLSTHVFGRMEDAIEKHLADLSKI